MRSRKTKQTPQPEPQPAKQTTGILVNDLEEFLAQSLFDQINKALNPNEPLPVSNN